MMKGLSAFVCSKQGTIIPQKPFHGPIREDAVPSERKKSQSHFIDRLRSSLGGQAGPQKKDGMPARTRFSIWYFLLAILLFMYVQQYLFSSKVETVSYSQFKQKVAEGSIGKLTIGPRVLPERLKGRRTRRKSSSPRFGSMTPASSRSLTTVR